ncbi:hypothetical protein RIF29_10276 [Crotalaria pallida]|uniref:Uncharacterized protein n=1 Tax=Crotalaria pallida TaxID=3830 RepID=A0AAN9FSQ5_CROPI
MKPSSVSRLCFQGSTFHVKKQRESRQKILGMPKLEGFRFSSPSSSIFVDYSGSRIPQSNSNPRQWGYIVQQGHVVLNEELTARFAPRNCTTWNCIDKVGNTHDIRLQRRGGAAMYWMKVTAINTQNLKIEIFRDDNEEEIEYQQDIYKIFLHPICRCKWCRVGSTIAFDCEVEIILKCCDHTRGILRLPESFVAEALPTSWKEYYVVDHHNLENLVDLVRSIENENDAYLRGD